ncbi:MAG: YgiQ family radical SAM protein [Planctomycetaceae bacterium]|jgi:uncharacterized radical SAM protein YgiQ|nr:YgiQ family radical SAM protein [Planctomycetaceae bacterium]
MFPISAAGLDGLGWDGVDVVFVTGDAYVDHPSFATALLARVLEADGFRVAVLAQPDWKTCDAWKTFGQPRLAFCVSSGNMDSMMNHYTAGRKVRNDDAYSPGGVIGKRPDRATLAYSQRAREAFPNVPIIVGGIEASLRRFSHYDYWSDKIRRSILLDSKADLLVYGMGESPLLEIMRLLRDGNPIRNDNGYIADEFRNIRGTAFCIGAKEDLPEEDIKPAGGCLHLPSHEEVVDDKKRFAEMTRVVYENLQPQNAACLIQQFSLQAVVVNPPSLPLSETELDRIYSLPFTRRIHPEYGNVEVPAFTMIKNSVTIHRGCYGGCTFCSITAHQGKTIQSRSAQSVCDEVKRIAAEPRFGGTISDIGGPTANMYKTGCGNDKAREHCRRLSCLAPKVCPHLNTDHSALIKLMRKVRGIDNVNNVFIASGVRTDLAMFDEHYIDELAAHHVGGHLKTAPEHTDPAVLSLMNKPPIENYDAFCELFHAASERAEKNVFIVPYLIAGFPGCTLTSMVSVAEYLKANNIRPEQVQEFIPGPFELAGVMYHAGLNPITGEQIYVAKGARERRLQKALLLYHDSEYYFDVKSALKETGREDLIGNSTKCLIPPYPPNKEMSMVRSSRVKRLMKKQETERVETEKRKQEQHDEYRPIIKPPSEYNTYGRPTSRDRNDRDRNDDRYKSNDRPYEKRERSDSDRDRYKSNDRPYKKRESERDETRPRNSSYKSRNDDRPPRRDKRD